MDKTCFNEVIDSLKALKKLPQENNTLSQFLDVIWYFKKVQQQRTERKRGNREQLPELSATLKALRIQVLPNRRNTSIEYLNQHAHKLRISCFELVDHNFRENTHSNILQYLFDHRFYKHAPNLLADFLEDYNTKIQDLRGKLLNKNYIIHREKSVGNGRIDLFIEDKKNNFVIVIENKVLADVSTAETEIDIDKEVTITQLDIYRRFVTNYYNGFDQEYILLSLKPIDVEHPPYRITDYQKLFEVVKSNPTKDPILEEYSILLRSLLNNIHDKLKLIKIVRKLDDEKANLNLNDIELLNNALLL